tara:strand:- start:118817 stop:119833 length:1017 start_codon:yes stop_codon:yes gene_type:complete
VEKSRTLVVGGTGFLGRYIVDALLGYGHIVTVVSRDTQKARALFPRKVKVVACDVGDSAEAWHKIFRKQDNLVFAAGVDERVPPQGDPLAFYRSENVDAVRKVLEAAADSGIKRVALLNSIFSTLDRLRPELGLAKHHSYITSRVEQRDMALATARGKFTMTVIEVPWVFGHARGSESQWGPLIQFSRTSPKLFAPRGGTVVISAANVGRATAGAIEYAKRSSATPVGDAWLSWEALLTGLAEACGRPDVSVVRVPDKLLVQFNEMSGFWQRLFRLRSGLDYGRMCDFLLDETPVNVAASQKRLHYGTSDIAVALAETAADVPESRAMRALRGLMSTA